MSAPEIAITEMLAGGPLDSRAVVAGMVERGFSPKQTRRARELLRVVIERAGSGASMRSTWRLPEVAEHCEESPRQLDRGAEYLDPGDSAPQPRRAFVPSSPAGRVVSGVVSMTRNVPRACETSGLAQPRLVPRLAAVPRGRGPRREVRAGDGQSGNPDGEAGLRTGRDRQAAPPEVPADGLTVGERQLHQLRVDAFKLRGIPAFDAGMVADALVQRDRDNLRAVGSCAECQCVEHRSCPTTPRPETEIHECWYMRRCVP